MILYCSKVWGLRKCEFCHYFLNFKLFQTCTILLFFLFEQFIFQKEFLE